MQARDVMTSPVISVHADAPIHDLVRLLLEHRIDHGPYEADEARRLLDEWWISHQESM